MFDPYQVVKDFESALCEYTGSPYAVTTTSCTMALLLAVAWHLQEADGGWRIDQDAGRTIEIPKRTYISVPMSIIHAGGWPVFRDEDWKGMYQLKPLPVWDSARWFTSGLYLGAHRKIIRAPSSAHPSMDMLEETVRNMAGQMVCLSFHWSKTLGIQQGGAILHDNPEADAWLRRARFDGRTEGVAPKDDTFDMIGYHAYMSPEIAAEGLMRLRLLPQHNDPLPNDEYPDLSKLAIFNQGACHGENSTYGKNPSEDGGSSHNGSG